MKQQKPNPLSGLDAGTIAEVFERTGGLEKLVHWCKNHRSEFYRTIYPRIVGVTVTGQVDAGDNNGDAAALAALERIIGGLIDARGADADATSNPNAMSTSPVPQPPPRSPPSPGAVIDDATYVRSTAPRAADPSSKPKPPPPRASAEPSCTIPGACIAQAFEAVDRSTDTTQKYYDWVNAGGRMRW